MASLTNTAGRFQSLVARVGDRFYRALQWTMASTPVLPRLQRPHLVVMPVLFASAVAIAAVILPGDNERIAALERDGQPRRALQLLENRYERGDRSSRVLFDMHRLYEYFGDMEKARGVIEKLADQRPRDAVIQRQLAQLYKATQDEPAYIRTLEKQIALRYSEPACKELIGLYRRSSAYAEEQNTIKQCRARGYRRPDDLIRYAFLEATDGNMAETAQTLIAVDDRLWLRAPRERQLLFASLIETKRPEEAVRRGIRWLRGRPDEDLSVDLIFKLVDAGRNDLAIQMAKSIGRPGDGVSLTVAEIMVDQSQAVAARAFLAGWLPENRGMDQELATRFITAALDADDPALALQGAEKFGLANFEQGEIGSLAEVLIATARGREFDKVRPFLTLETIAANPMLAAGIELRLGRNEQARNNLMRVRPDELSERRLGHFARLIDQAGRSPGLMAVLREPRVAAVLAPNAVAAPPVVGATPAPAIRPSSQARAEAARKRLKERRKAAAKAAPSGPAASPPASTGTFQFPQQ